MMLEVMDKRLEELKMVEVVDKRLEEMNIKLDITDKRLQELKMIEVMDKRLEEMKIKKDITDKRLEEIKMMLEPAEGEQTSKNSTPAGVKNQSPNNPRAEGDKSGLEVVHPQILYTMLPLLFVAYHLYNQEWIPRRNRRWQIRDERRVAAVTNWTVENHVELVRCGDDRFFSFFYLLQCFFPPLALLSIN